MRTASVKASVKELPKEGLDVGESERKSARDPGDAITGMRGFFSSSSPRSISSAHIARSTASAASGSMSVGGANPGTFSFAASGSSGSIRVCSSKKSSSSSASRLLVTSPPTASW